MNVPCVLTFLEGGDLYRTEIPVETVNIVLETGALGDQLVAFLRWPTGNFDFMIDAPRVFFPDDFERVYSFAVPLDEPGPERVRSAEGAKGSTPPEEPAAPEEPHAPSPPAVEGQEA